MIQYVYLSFFFFEVQKVLIDEQRTKDLSHKGLRYYQIRLGYDKIRLPYYQIRLGYYHKQSLPSFSGGRLCDYE
jgi:hypothetical protein